MPLHEWAPVPSGLFHHFHQCWTVELARALNAGLLPAGLCALIEHRTVRANRIAIKHGFQRIVAKLDVISPGNKDSRAALQDYVQEMAGFLRNGIHLLIVDVFPPSSRDPFGIHKAIWDEISEGEFSFQPGKDRILASYACGEDLAAYVEPIAVGDILPDMALFVASEHYVQVPLESTYRIAWDTSPEAFRNFVLTGE